MLPVKRHQAIKCDFYGHRGRDDPERAAGQIEGIIPIQEGGQGQREGMVAR